MSMTAKSFTYLAIMFCLISAIKHIYEGLEFSSSIIENSEDEMIEQLYACIAGISLWAANTHLVGAGR
jgi:hypothetical protein